jgi:hypothetical protein
LYPIPATSRRFGSDAVESEQIEQVRVRVLPDGRLNRKDAAAYLGKAPKTLAMWALERKGPKPVRVGGRIFYLLDDLRRFVGQADAA